jgi:hypothetical protein
VGPQSGTLSTESGPFPGNADVLAREAASHDLSDTLPRSSVEYSNVVGDRKEGKHTITLSLLQHADWIGLDFDSTAAGMPKKSLGEQAAARSREQV